MPEAISPSFPLSAVVGQDDLKLALCLHALQPRLGGVLIRGEKGSGKSTTARGLAALLPPITAVAGCRFACPPSGCPHVDGAQVADQRPAPFVELPVGATEDRVVGALDLEGALTEGRRRLQPGLLASAHRGVLYVDEVNLLPDHLVDVLIDAAASGVNRVERDGLTVEHASRFVLVGSMNPEEGELRPQLLDRFGLAVEVRAPLDPALRTEVVRRRLSFDADPLAFRSRFAPQEAALATAIEAGQAALERGVDIPDEVLALASGLCADLGAEGLRADLVLARGAAALAAFEGRPAATVDDVARLAPLALAHRRRRGPLDAPGLEPGELEAALDRHAAAERPPGHDDDPHDPDGPQEDSQDDAHGPLDEDDRDSADRPGGAHRPPSAPAAGIGVHLEAVRPSGALGRRQRGPAPRGGVVAARPADTVTDLAIGATVTAAAIRRALTLAPDGAPTGVAPASPAPPGVEAGDLRQAVREARTAHLVVLAVDTSGSMGAQRRIEAAKGAVLSLLLDAYQRRDRVALVTFAGDTATVVLRPTGSVEVARSRLAALPTGGRTPLAAGLRTALEVARQSHRQDPGRRAVLVVVTDGRATSGPETSGLGTSGGGSTPTDDALAAAAEVRAAGLDVLVVDAEDSAVRLGLARTLADHMGARHTVLADLAGAPLAGVVNDFLLRSPQPGFG